MVCQLYLRKRKRKCGKLQIEREIFLFNGLGKAESSFHLIGNALLLQCFCSFIQQLLSMCYVQESRQYLLPLACCLLKASISKPRSPKVRGNCRRGPVQESGTSTSPTHSCLPLSWRAQPNSRFTNSRKDKKGRKINIPTLKCNKYILERLAHVRHCAKCYEYQDIPHITTRNDLL